MRSLLKPVLKAVRLATAPLAAAALVTAGALLAPASAQEQETPRYGGSMVIALATEPATLNVVFTTNLPESMVSANLFSKLIRLDINEDFKPELARSWEVSEDGLTYTFHLADNVKWHDGQPFTSADVKFSLENLTRKFHPQANMMEPLASIETPDDHTVVMRLSKPSEPLIAFLALRAYILPKHIYEGTEARENPANTRPIGTGPFRFVEWERGSHITLERNPDYFEEGLPYLDQMVFQIMPDASSRVLALETGEIDYLTHDIPSTALESLRANPDITVTNAGVSSIVSIGQLMLNHQRKPFDDVRVRRALAKAIDKDFVAERATLGAFTRADGPIHSATKWAYAGDALKIYPHDVAEAERLLDEAGLTKGANGVRFSMKILAPRGREDETRAAEILAQLYNQIGIQTSVSVLDTAALAEVSYVNRDFDAMVNSVTTGPDPAVGVQRQYVTSNIRPVPFTNASAYSNEEVDRLFEQAAKATSREERAAAYRRVQEILTDEAVVLWLWEIMPYSAWRNEFRNLHTDSAAANYYLYTAWWTGGEAR